MTYSTKEGNLTLAKPIMNFNSGLVKFGLTSLVKQVIGNTGCQDISINGFESFDLVLQEYFSLRTKRVKDALVEDTDQSNFSWVGCRFPSRLNWISM